MVLTTRLLRLARPTRSSTGKPLSVVCSTGASASSTLKLSLKG